MEKILIVKKLDYKCEFQNKNFGKILSSGKYFLVLTSIFFQKWVKLQKILSQNNV